MLEWLQDIDWLEVILEVIFGVCVFIVVGRGVFVADVFITEPYTVQGQVIGAEYTPESEKWTLVISVKGKVETFEVSPDMFYSVKVGEPVKMSCRKGKIIGIVSCMATQPRALRTGYQPP